VLCQQTVEETNAHLFLNCQFAKLYWRLIGITIQSGSDILEIVIQIRDQAQPNFFLMAAILMCWLSGQSGMISLSKASNRVLKLSKEFSEKK